MTYRFALTRTDRSDFATGRVFYGLPGRTAFPVRLADELFQRCLAHHGASGPGGVALYDPCCGGASLLAAIAYLHWARVRSVVASDVDPDILPLASRNLALLTHEGLRQREAQISALHALHGKDSHAAALESAQRLRARLAAGLAQHALPTHLFLADATDPVAVRAGLGPATVDIVITDVPYGLRSSWQHAPDREQLAQGQGQGPLWALLEALRPVLAPGAVVAIVSDKTQKPRHEAYARADRFQIGHRRVEVLAVLGTDNGRGDDQVPTSAVE